MVQTTLRIIGLLSLINSNFYINASQALVGNKPDLNRAFLSAAYRGNFEAMCRVLHQGANILTKTDNTQNSYALHLATDSTSEPCVR